ncbi:MAG: hypothetical protein AAFQ09_10110 [Pseudomonadota bacterium]
MRKLGLLATLLAGSALATPALADGHLRIVDEPLELTIQMNHARYPIYEEDWPVEQKARELTGIHLINDTVGANMRTDENTGRTEALNLMLASGNIPDIVGSSRIRDFVNQFGPEGAFVPLNDLIAEHAPNIAAYYAERPDIEAAVKAADGQMYYIPYLPDGKYGRAYWIRTDWLDALDLEVPQTVEEYENVLRAFKTQDPNGNGEADEVPLFFRQWPELLLKDRLAVDHVIMFTFDAKVRKATAFFSEPEVEVLDRFYGVFIGVTNRPAIRLHQNAAMFLNTVSTDRGRRRHCFESKAFDFAGQAVVAAGGRKPVMCRPTQVL